MANKPGRIIESIATRCVICTQNVPENRAKFGAITCGEECAKARRRQKDSRMDMRECRYCRRPSTPEERAAFQRFRKMESERPDLLYPAAYQAWEKQHADADTENALQDFIRYRKEDVCQTQST